MREIVELLLKRSDTLFFLEYRSFERFYLSCKIIVRLSHDLFLTFCNSLPLFEGVELFFNMPLNKIGDFFRLLLVDFFFHILHDFPQLLLEFWIQSLFVFEIFNILTIFLILLYQPLFHTLHNLFQWIVSHLDWKNFLFNFLTISYFCFIALSFFIVLFLKSFILLS